MSDTMRYIGARYVPKFYENSLDPTSTDWQPNVMYEPLTVVTCDNNHTYISKKFVPDEVGNPADNAEYWLDQGSYNAYIQGLQDQVDVITGDIGNISNLATPSTENLVNAINSIANKKYIFIGDSYAHLTANNGWMDILPSVLGLSSSDYYTAALGGIGFASTTNFKDMLESLDGTITNKNLITDIVVLGGINDYYQEEDNITAGVDSFLAYAKANYPNALVSIGMISGNSNPAWIGPNFNKIIRCYSNVKGGRYLKNIEFVLHNYSFMASDMIHPTATGMAILAQRIAEALNDGCSVHYYDYKPLVNPITNWTFEETCYAGVSIDNETLSLRFSPSIPMSTTDSGSYMNLQFGAAVFLFDITSDLLLGYNQINVDRTYNSIPCIANVRGRTTPKFYSVIGKIEIINKHVYFTSCDRQITYNASDFANIDQFTLRPLSDLSAYTCLT